MHSSDELFQRSRECYFGIYFPSCETAKEIYTKITLEWAPKQFATRVLTLFLLLARHNESINDDKNNDRYTPSPRHFSFCWWRHNQLLMTSQWPHNCDTITWIMVSNSLDIDFIYGDIHGRSCKKNNYVYFKLLKLLVHSQTSTMQPLIFGNG